MFKTGFTRDQAIEGLGSLVPTLLNLFLGTFGMGPSSGESSDLSSIAYDPGLYAALRKAAEGESGIISYGGAYTNTFQFDTFSGGEFPSSDGAAVPGGFDGSADAPAGSVPIPAGGPPRSEAAGIAAATALWNAGFRTRQDLETITAISWRESGWNPSSKNPNTSDRGLMQINMSAHRDTLRDLGYGESDLLNIQKNANVAHLLWSRGGGNYASFQQLWGFSTNSPYVPGGVGWDRNGDPLGRTQGSNAAGIVGAAGLPGLGDVDMSRMHDTTAYSMDPTTYAPTLPVTSDSGKTIVFNNNFTISGGGGGQGGGIDVRRTVTMLAEQLEGEMRKRLARQN